MNTLKDLLSSENLVNIYYIHTDPRVLSTSESHVSSLGANLLEIGNIPSYLGSYIAGGYEKLQGGPLVWGTEDKFIGFAELVRFPKEFYPPYGLVFDIDLNLTIHSIESIIYRLMYGTQGGLGVGYLVGLKFTNEFLMQLKLGALDLMNTLSYFGYKGTLLGFDVERSEFDPTVLVVRIKEKYE